MISLLLLNRSCPLSSKEKENDELLHTRFGHSLWSAQRINIVLNCGLIFRCVLISVCWLCYTSDIYIYFVNAMY